MITLNAQDISKAFGGLHVLRRVSLTIRQGQVTALIGPNGAGKTTLANIITGFSAPDDGRIILGDRDVTKLDVHRRARLGMGRTFQNLQLFNELSVRENVVLGRYGKFRRPAWSCRPSAEDYAEADASLEKMGLADCAERAAGALSFGQSKMLELARLHVMKPDIVIMDEPAAGLPGDRTAELGKWIRSMREQGIGMMLIEHNMRLVMGVADYVYVLDRGEMIAEGHPQAVRENAQVLKAYLGGPVGAVL
ncbi:MAG TPA: ABC transporter ATP-binding protein [Rhodoblastus sp.]|nr:ABC transporter ATP-binding protein [Rhodoblastus sp.]